MLNKAQWIWMHGNQIIQEGQQHEHIYFRRGFVLDKIEGFKLHIKVSADSRYCLFINGYLVSRGPSKGDNHTHYYEEVDCTSYLREGHNVIAANVVHYRGIDGPISVWRANGGGFILAGEVIDSANNSIEKLHTDDRWLCLQETAINYEVSYGGTEHLGGAERVNGVQLIHGWNSINYNDSNWHPAVKVSDYEGDGYLTPWNLTQRNIPQLFEKKRSFKQVTKIGGKVIIPPQKDAEYIGKPFAIGPNQSFKIDLDAGEMTTGYPVLKLKKGKGANVKLVYAECYKKTDPKTGEIVKGKRDDATGELFGEYDLYKVSGFGSDKKFETFEPFAFRTFWFMSLEIETGDEELIIDSFYYKETGYPLEVKSTFFSSDSSLQPLWNISINTLKRCMHETYEDCPYYEQLQYAMDTRLQALFTYQLSGDDRLARKAIFDFHSSRLPNGMLQSRYPSVLPQVIPGFSLHWIMMVHDHYQYFGDLSLVRTYLPTIDGVLEWFNRRIESNGLLGEMPSKYWSFVDWVDGWPHGAPPISGNGSLIVYNLMYITAIKLAAELHDALGRKDTGNEYRLRALALIQTINKTSYSDHTRLYQDAPHTDLYSQHTQVWAVLAGAVQGVAASQLMERTLVNRDLAQVSYAMSFYLFRALEKAGSYDKSFSLWNIWKNLAELGLTSWVEDPVTQRSDCHAWGSVPIYEFSANILGVKPATPGFKVLRIAPQLGDLKQASGDVATPKGIVKVAWELNEEKQFKMTVSTKIETQLEIILPDNTVFNHQGAGDYQFACQLK